MPFLPLLSGEVAEAVEAPQAGTPLGVEFGAHYAIVGPDGTRASFNQREDPDHVGYLIGEDAVTGLERAAVRENAEPLAEGDGGIHGAFLRDRLAFTLKGIIEPGLSGDPANTVAQDRLMRATNALRRDATLAWQPTLAPAMLVRFREQQPTRIAGRRPKTFLVAGVCEDPTIYGLVPRIRVVEPGAAGEGGMASPIVSPLASGAAVAGQADLENVGRAPAWPVVTVEGPCTNPVIRNHTHGLELALVYTLAAGERLVIDTNPRRRTILLQGQADRYSALDFVRSRWWAVESGVNDVRVSFAAFSAGCTVTFEWRDAW